MSADNYLKKRGGKWGKIILHETQINRTLNKQTNKTKRFHTQKLELGKNTFKECFNNTSRQERGLLIKIKKKSSKTKRNKRRLTEETQEINESKKKIKINKYM